MLISTIFFGTIILVTWLLATSFKKLDDNNVDDSFISTETECSNDWSTICAELDSLVSVSKQFNKKGL